MALLKKIVASTLMETLVATVLIVIIFTVSSMIMNNMVTANIRRNTSLLNERLNVLGYKLSNDGINVPYYEAFGTWEITIEGNSKNDHGVIEMNAINRETKRKVSAYVIHEK